MPRRSTGSWGSPTPASRPGASWGRCRSAPGRSRSTTRCSPGRHRSTGSCAESGSAGEAAGGRSPYKPDRERHLSVDQPDLVDQTVGNVVDRDRVNWIWSPAMNPLLIDHVVASVDPLNNLAAQVWIPSETGLVLGSHRLAPLHHRCACAILHDHIGGIAGQEPLHITRVVGLQLR